MPLLFYCSLHSTHSCSAFSCMNSTQPLRIPFTRNSPPQTTCCMPPLTSLLPSAQHPQFILKNSNAVPDEQWSCRWPPGGLLGGWLDTFSSGAENGKSVLCLPFVSCSSQDRNSTSANLFLVDTGTPFGNLFSSFSSITLMSYSSSSLCVCVWHIKHRYPPRSSWLPSTRWWCAGEEKESWKFKVK